MKKPDLKPEDIHLVFNFSIDADMYVGGKLKCFVPGNPTPKWVIPASGKGVYGPGESVTGSDTPAGLYKCGTITTWNPSEPIGVLYAFGKYFIDLVELENQEVKYGRGGVGIHGGGSASPNPTADNQGLWPTHGCIRVLNKDLPQVVDSVRWVQRNGGIAYVSVAK